MTIVAPPVVSTARGRPDREYAFDVVATDAALDALEPEWSALFARSRSRNPFAHPAWMIPWLQAYARDERRRVVIAVRAGGELVGVAPFHRVAQPLGATALQLAGGLRGGDRLTERSEILLRPEGERKAMRRLLHFAATEVGGWDWLGLTLSPRQGWFETEWLPEGWRRRGGFVLHKAARPSVVLPLPARWEDLRLKRNLKEALRRSRNRLQRLDEATEVVFNDGAALPTAVASLVELHRLRAQDSVHLGHDDYFAAEPARRLLAGAVDRWTRDGDAAVAELRLAGRPIAARLVLRANDAHFLSFSGVDVEHWSLGASATLVAAAIRRAIGESAALVDFSASPDSAKLRWSETLAYEQEFVAIAPSRRSRLRFSLWWQARARRSVASGRRLVSDQLPALRA